jgi:hypothetical protein
MAATQKETTLHLLMSDDVFTVGNRTSQSSTQYNHDVKQQEDDEQFVSSITKQEACNGLMIAIAYVQVAYPACADDHVRNLQAVLQLLDHDDTDNQNIETESTNEGEMCDYEDKDPVKQEGYDDPVGHGDPEGHDDPVGQNDNASSEADELCTTPLSTETIDYEMTSGTITPIEVKHKKRKRTRKKKTATKQRKRITRPSATTNNELDSDMQSVPLLLTLKASCIPDVGTGVFTSTAVPERTLFGPLPNWMVVSNAQDLSQFRLERYFLNYSFP